MTNDKQVKGAVAGPGVAHARELLKQKPNWDIELDANQVRVLSAWLKSWPPKPKSFASTSEIFWAMDAPAGGFGPDDIEFLRSVVRFNNGPVSAEEYILPLKTPIDTATKRVDTAIATNVTSACAEAMDALCYELGRFRCNPPSEFTKAEERRVFFRECIETNIIPEFQSCIAQFKLVLRERLGGGS